MSVLVEALSLVIPRTILDASYPGGTETFMLDMCEPDIPARLVCADDQLVSVSFPHADAALGIGAHLLDLGITAVDEDCFLELAFVDQEDGPTMPCDWIEWQTDAGGVTSCWLAGTEPEPLHASATWTPEHSRRLAFQGHRAEPGRGVKLADENGVETWLDFQTGHVVSGLPALPLGMVHLDISLGDTSTLGTEPDPFAENEEGEGDDLMSTVRSMLDANTYRYHQPSSETLAFTIVHEHATYSLFFVVQVTKSLVQLMSNYGSHAPDDRRIAVAEALSRINTVLGLGNFELDFSDGDIRFRVACDVEEGVLSEKMASNMLNCTMYCMERFHGALMRIMFAEIEPAVALDGLA